MKFFSFAFKLNISRIIRLFIVSDLFLWGGWGLIAPIFAVFVVDEVPGATLITVGVGTAIYWIVKSIIQIPVARFLDRTDGERDDFYTLLLGLVLAGFVAFGFVFVTAPWHIYLMQLFQAIAFGLYIPAWYSMFSRHLDRGRYAIEWSLDSSGIGVGAGIAGLVGGSLALAVGFKLVFVLAGIFSLAAAAALLAAPRLIFPPAAARKTAGIQDHTKPL